MDDHSTTPMDALLAKVDAVIRSTGGDPGGVSTDDKILLAAQYIEVSIVNAITVTAHRAGRVRL